MRKVWCVVVLCLVMTLSCAVVFAGSNKPVVKKKENGREKLAVLDLEAKWGVEQDFAEGLSVLVRDEIHRFGKYEVMSREDIAAVASREAMLQAMGCDESGTCLVDFGRTLGTRFMVAGSVSKFGTTYSISLRLLDTKGESAGVVNRVSDSCKCSIDDFIETVHRVAGKLVGHDEAAIAAGKAKLAADIKQLQEKKERGTSERKKRRVAAVSSKSVKRYNDPVTGMGFVRIKGGCFQMGSPFSEKDRDGDEGPRHRVCVDEFLMGKHEVTVGQWREFIRSSDYRTDAERDLKKDGCYSLKGGEWGYHDGRYWDNVGFPQKDSQPVACVSHNDVIRFVDWLKRESGKEFRLPTEAEWEYAARAGTTTARFWGDGESSACKYANIADKYFPCDDGYEFSSPVGSFSPNNFGLYDMLGNVWEWTGDWYKSGYYEESPRDNPLGAALGSRRVDRGGGWGGRPTVVRSAFRGGVKPWVRYSGLGFRLVFSPNVVE